MFTFCSPDPQMYLWLHYNVFICSIQITNISSHYLLLQSLSPTDFTRKSKWLMKKALEQILIFLAPCLMFCYLSASANTLSSVRKQFWNIWKVYGVNSIEISNQISAGTKSNALAIFMWAVTLEQLNCSDMLSWPPRFIHHDHLSSKQNYHWAS